MQSFSLDIRRTQTPLEAANISKLGRVNQRRNQPYQSPALSSLPTSPPSPPLPPPLPSLPPLVPHLPTPTVTRPERFAKVPSGRGEICKCTNYLGSGADSKSYLQPGGEGRGRGCEEGRRRDRAEKGKGVRLATRACHVGVVANGSEEVGDRKYGLRSNSRAKGLQTRDDQRTVKSPERKANPREGKPQICNRSKIPNQGSRQAQQRKSTAVCTSSN